MIDTHCHLTFPQLSDRLDDVLLAASEAGVSQMISVGTTPADAAKARDIADRRPQVFFSAGIHPHYVDKADESELPYMAELANEERCVAFGEMGLDYHYDKPPRDLQQRLFNAQLEAIRYSEINKPIILHCRKAVDDTLAMLRASGLSADRFVFHCFTETPGEMRKVLDFGAMVSFTGIVTYKNAPEVREACLLVPDDRIMVETDAPYLSPEPFRKVRPNEPRYVTATAAFLAELRKTDPQAFEQQLDTNARRFFRLPEPGQQEAR
ncbi:MAG: TatD family hydrolase [Phycisphaeraceae bacterium]